MRLVNNTCAQACKLPCKECLINDPTMCTSCITGFNLVADGQTCNPNLDCNADKNCLACPLGYNLLLGTCKKCEGALYCKACDIMNVERCAACEKGYYLS